jgi:hypothetical protein
MKKILPLAFSASIALMIAFYSRKSAVLSPSTPPFQIKSSWKTFEKKSHSPEAKREIAQEKNIGSENDIQSLPQNSKNLGYFYRHNRVLIGDTQKNDYQSEEIQLEMINRSNQNWKDILGNELIRFQNEDTKVMIKEEFPVIKIQNGKGRYLEQVIVTYLFKNGNSSSYRALVDSESGAIIETWDKTIHEKIKIEGAGLSLPSVNESGIIAK